MSKHDRLKISFRDGDSRFEFTGRASTVRAAIGRAASGFKDGLSFVTSAMGMPPAVSVAFPPKMKKGKKGRGPFTALDESPLPPLDDPSAPIQWPAQRKRKKRA